jgi:hypothetical protein
VSERDDSTAELAGLCFRASSGRLTLRDIKPPERVPVTVAEWDVTPGLREWIAQEAANAPASEARWSRLALKLLAMHDYSDLPSKRGPGFYCDPCHVDDGVIEGGGNCPTILALAEAYGLDEPGEDGTIIVSR